MERREFRASQRGGPPAKGNFEFLDTFKYKVTRGLKSSLVQAAVLGALLSAVTSSSREQAPLPRPDRTNETKIMLTGCLIPGEGKGTFDLYIRHSPRYSEGGDLFHLVGNMLLLERFQDNQAITVEGTKDESTSPPIIHFVSAKEAKPPSAALSPAVINNGSWQTDVSREYGVSYARPRNFLRDQTSSDNDDPNFVVEDDVTIDSFRIPEDVYLSSKFLGGKFYISVNPTIGTPENCERFRNFDRAPSSPMIGSIRYSQTDIFSVGGGGSLESDHYFHTFQNGLCYGITFLYRVGGQGYVDGDCMIPGLTEKDLFDFMERLIGKISFFRPAIDTH